MAPPAAGGSLAVALARRNELGGATGYRALVQNAHVFGLAVRIEIAHRRTTLAHDAVKP